MDVLHKLKKAYSKERKSTLNRSYLTGRGIFLRIANSDKYWDELDNQEALLLDRGRFLLAKTLADQPKTDDDLKNYQWTLKNVNAKFAERGNFLLALVTLITALSLAKINDVFGWVDGFWSDRAAFCITAAAIALSVIDTVRVRSRAAIHEELINVIEKYLQTPPAVAAELAKMPFPEQSLAPQSTLAMRRMAKIVSRDTYAGLFKAATVVFGIALIGMSQTGPVLYDKELDAYTAKFKLEEALGRPLEQIDCQFLTANKADCQMAQHKIETSGTAMDLLNTVVISAMRVGMCLFLLALFFFVATPFMPDADEKNSSQ